MDYNITLQNQENYILNILHKKDAKNNFKTPYGRFSYLHTIVQRLIKTSNIDPVKPNPQTQPEPQATPQKRPVWIDKLVAGSNQPQSTPEVADSKITKADLFEPTPIHAVWAKLSEDQRRENWERAIAEHRKNHVPKVYDYDEMY